MSNDLTHPKFRIRAWWNFNYEEPEFRIGIYERNHHYYTVEVPFDTPNDRIYRKAEAICVLVSRRADFHFRAEFNRNYLYNDLHRIRGEHYRHQHREVAQNEFLNQAELRNNWANDYERRKAAELKAQELLVQHTSAEFAAHFRSEQEVFAFYFTPKTPGPTYIIDPGNRNLIRLDFDHPTGLCVYLSDRTVQQNLYDWAVAIYLYLRGAQRLLHETANEYRFLRPTNWVKENELSSAQALNTELNSEVLLSI